MRNSTKWGKAFLETMLTGDMPRNEDMPDRDPLGDWTSSAIADDTAWSVVQEAEEKGNPE